MIDVVSGLKCPIAVGSNSSLKHVEWALRKTGLDRFFGDRVFSAAQVAQPKPASDLFLHIARTLGVSVENCIVVEDSTSGVMAARNAGMKVIGFTGAAHFIPSLEKRLGAAQPTWLCSNTTDLKRLFGEFETR
jgi:beta-phosphoglucomutase-like phosphatase (HAD superfamily)